MIFVNFNFNLFVDLSSIYSGRSITLLGFMLHNCFILPVFHSFLFNICRSHFVLFLVILFLFFISELIFFIQF